MQATAQSWMYYTKHLAAQKGHLGTPQKIPQTKLQTAGDNFQPVEYATKGADEDILHSLYVFDTLFLVTECIPPSLSLFLSKLGHSRHLGVSGKVRKKTD